MARLIVTITLDTEHPEQLKRMLEDWGVAPGAVDDALESFAVGHPDGWIEETAEFIDWKYQGAEVAYA